MNRVDLEGRTFVLRNDNTRARRFREETATDDAHVIVTVLSVRTAVSQGRFYETADLLVLFDDSEFGFPNALPLNEMSEVELWRELARS